MFQPLKSTRNVLRKRWGRSQCGHFRSNMRARVEVGSRGGRNLPGYSGISWSNDTVYARVETSTSGNYHETPFLRGVRCVHQVDG